VADRAAGIVATRPPGDGLSATLSPLCLQAAFRRYLDMTPLAHLRSVRMTRAIAICRMPVVSPLSTRLDPHTLELTFALVSIRLRPVSADVTSRR
jgi:hypothetical protein